MRPRWRSDAAPARSLRSALGGALQTLLGGVAALALALGGAPAAAAAQPAQVAQDGPAAHQPGRVRTRPAPSAPAAPADQVSVSIEALTPEILTTGEDLTISGTVTNNTSSDLAAGALIVQMQSSTDVSASQTQAWLDSERDGDLVTIATSALDAPVAAGASTEFTLTIPGTNMPLSDASHWGPRGLQVVVNDGQTPVAQDRTLALWDAGAGVQTAQTTVVVPVVASPKEQVLLASAPAGLEEATRADLADDVDALRERVQGLLSLARPGVVLAVDPALLAAFGVGTAPGAGTPGSPDQAPAATPTAQSSAEPGASTSPGPAGGSALPWTSVSESQELKDALSTAMASGEVIALPWADADLAALSHLGADSLGASALTRAQEATASWPAADTADASASTGQAAPSPSASASEQSPQPLTTVLASGETDTGWLHALPQTVTSVITEPGDLPPARALTYTPSGTAVVEGRTMIIPDGSMSATASTRADPAGNVVRTGQNDATVAYSELDVRQHLRAGTAVLTRQAPNLARHVIISISRLSASTTDPQVLEQRIEALTESGWTTPASLSDVVAQARAEEADGTLVRRRTPPSNLTMEGEMTSADLDRARAVGDHLSSVSSVLAAPASLLGTAPDVVASAASTIWRTDPTSRSGLLTTAAGGADRVVKGLNVAPMSTVNVISETADLPLRLTSSLDQDATVVVRVTPSSPRVRTSRTVTVTVPARGQATAPLPIESVGNGDVDLRVDILASDGTVVGTSTTIHTRVRAGWESLGVRIVAGVLLVLLIAGVTRTIRNGRRSHRAADPVPEPSEHPAQEMT